MQIGPVRRVAALMAVGIALLGTPATASANTVVRAELEGIPIPTEDISRWYCHDLASPTITCFREAASLEASLANSTAAASLYVTVYSDSGYTGSYAHLSEDYDGLWVIGWNDHISAFVGRNGASGEFYTDWYAGGDRYGFCCNAEVSYLGAFDNTFSSVYRT